jgi:polyferredoxin
VRRPVQLVAALLQNAYLAFPWTRNIYQGPLKRLCTPGLNCYSCPAAVVSCPLGALQHFIAGVRPALRWGTYRLGFYVVGLLAAVGLVGGRFSCGWLCPFGLLQDLLYRLPGPKLRLPRRVGWLRYAVLAVTVVALPALLTGAMGYGEAWFCRLLCPAGTLEAGSLLWLIPELREQTGWFFTLKAAVLAAVLGLSVASFRPYCRGLCPLGAIYGWFNRVSLIGLVHHPRLCTDCEECARGCLSGLDPRADQASTECLRCLACATERCTTGALRVRIGAAAATRVPAGQTGTPGPGSH